MKNGVVERTTIVSGTARVATLSGLSPSTWYTVQVAAVNGAGTGAYNTGISIRASGKCKIILKCWNINLNIHSATYIVM